LHTDGRRIVDDEGTEVKLRGVAFSGYEGGGDKHYESDYAQIRNWGFNVVRLPIAWNYIEPQPGVYDLAHLANIVDRDIAWAKKYGIYIVLDMHQWVWSSYFSWWGGHGNGLPEWAVRGYPNTFEGCGIAITDFWLGKGPNGTTASSSNPSMQDRYIEMWKFVANHYKNEPHIIYDVFNEPYRGDYYYPAGGLDEYATAPYLYRFYNRLIPAIRQIDPDRIIMYEPVSGWHVPAAQKLNYPNLIFSFHCYDYAGNYNGDRAMLERNFWDKFMSYPQPDNLANWQMPVWLGEFGCADTAPYYEQWIKDMASVCADYNIGWSWWYYTPDTSVSSSSLLDGNRAEKTTLTIPLRATLTAPVDAPHITLGIGVSDSTLGTVSPSGLGIYYIGNNYTFTATATAFGVFDHWDHSGTNWGYSNPLTVTITADMQGTGFAAMFRAK
jgi:endoglycosylceramidase